MWYTAGTMLFGFQAGIGFYAYLVYIEDNKRTQSYNAYAHVLCTVFCVINILIAIIRNNRKKKALP